MDEKIIQFVDYKDRALFTLPDGMNITVTGFNGKRSNLSCKHVNKNFAEIDGRTYGLLEFARIMEREGAVYAPNWTRPEDASGVYEIYQIKDTRSTDYAFRSFEEAKKDFNPLDYRRVYASMLAPGVTLDELFTRHNYDDRPFGDKIRSMSMSDIVILSRDGHSTAHYVDTYGFTVAPQFLEPKPVPGTMKEVVSGYTITVRIPVNNKVFVLAENPNAASPFVTWQGHKTSKGYDWGHYYDRRADAVKDLYGRVSGEMDNLPFTPEKANRRDYER